jgi:hypothetical protein
MRIRECVRNWLSALAVFTCLGAASAPTLAATVARFQQKGVGADAEWFQVDSCVFSDLSISAFASVTPSGGSPLKFVSLNNVTYNSCTGASSYTDTPDPFATQTQLSVDVNLAKATLTGTIPTSVCVFDPTSGGYNCASHTVAVNLTWEKTSQLSHSGYNARFVSASGLFRQGGTGSMVSAIASGSIVQDNTVSLITGNSQFGDMLNSLYGEITVIHR